MARTTGSSTEGDVDAGFNTKAAIRDWGPLGACIGEAWPGAWCGPEATPLDGART